MARVSNDPGQISLEPYSGKALVTASWGSESRRVLLPMDSGLALYTLITSWDDIRIALTYVREVADRYALTCEYRV